MIDIDKKKSHSKLISYKLFISKYPHLSITVFWLLLVWFVFYLESYLKLNITGPYLEVWFKLINTTFSSDLKLINILLSTYYSLGICISPMYFIKKIYLFLKILGLSWMWLFTWCIYAGCQFYGQIFSRYA